jgi:hypothetical protein
MGVFCKAVIHPLLLDFGYELSGIKKLVPLANTCPNRHTRNVILPQWILNARHSSDGSIAITNLELIAVFSVFRSDYNSRTLSGDFSIPNTEASANFKCNVSQDLDSMERAFGSSS